MDIRDLVAEEEEFDPLAEAAEDEQPQEDDEQPLIGAPLEEASEEEAHDERPADIRIRELLDQMPGQRRLLLKLIAYCRDAKTGEEMDAYTEKLQEYCYSVYSPVILRELLEKAGAIAYLPDPDEEGAAGAEGAAAESAAGTDVAAGGEGAVASSEDAVASEGAGASAEAAAGSETTAGSAVASAGTSAAAAATGSASVAGAEQGARAAVAAPEEVDGSPVVREAYDDGEEQVDVEYLEVEENKPGAWLATDEGLAIVDEQDDYKKVEELLAREPRYLNIYKQLIDFCTEDGGRSIKEMDNLVNDDPLLQQPRRYSGYFVARLEREGAIEWRDGWCTTDTGLTVLKELVAQAAQAAQTVAKAS